jgi:hypothetical protein
MVTDMSTEVEERETHLQGKRPISEVAKGQILNAQCEGSDSDSEFAHRESCSREKDRFETQGRWSELKRVIRTVISTAES